MFLLRVYSVPLMLLIFCCPSTFSTQSPSSPAAAGPASPTKTSEYCNMETFRARCQHGDVIVMETALFGRMRVGRCITSDAYLTALQQLDPTSLGCSATVLAYVDRVCSGRPSCDVNVPNPDLYSFHPCSGPLTMHLEVSYSCVAVVEEDRSCQISVQVGSRLHIAGRPRSDLRGSSVRCGSRSHPWLLEAQTGQQVNISLLDFTGHGRRTQLGTRGLVSHDCSPAGVQYGYVVDKTNKKNVSICSSVGQERHRHVYQTAANSIEIVLTSPQLDEDEDVQIMNFLLAFEAVGCSNLVPPSDAWLRRTDNEATIGCYTTRQRWNLRCHGNQWKGTIGACSTQDDAVHSVKYEDVDTAEDNSDFVNVLLIVSVSFVGLAVCLIIIFVGIGCARRYGIDKMPTGGRNLLVGCKDDQLITGQLDFQYNNGQTHSQFLPQYFVLDKDAVDAAT